MYHFYRLYVKGIDGPLGFVHATTIVEFPWPAYWTYDANDKSLTFSGGKTVAERNNLLQKTLIAARNKAWRMKEPNPPLEPLRRFHYEALPVYAYDGQHVMDVDLAAAEMFGIPAYSVALTAWTNMDGRRRYWIPQLTSDHPHLAEKYDNVVSGMLKAGGSHFELVKELAHLQAGLTADIIDDSMSSCGTISYICHRHHGGLIHTVQPHVQYVYEIELDPKVHLVHAEECQSLRTYSFGQVWKLLEGREFEPHTQMTMLAHFIRHG